MNREAEKEYFPYKDILYATRPVSKTHPRMSAEARAAQFAPFAALTGYGDAVEEMAEDHRIRVENEILHLKD